MDTTALAERLERFVATRGRMRGIDHEVITMSNDVPLLTEDLREAATRLRAVAGEPVAHRWVRNGVPPPYWVGGVPSERQFQAARDCKDIAEWTVEYAYTRPQPATPATVTDEDVERAQLAVIALNGACATMIPKSEMRAALESFANKEPTDE